MIIDGVTTPNVATIAPIFFIQITSDLLNIAMISIMSLVCTYVLLKILKKEGKEDGVDL